FGQLGMARFMLDGHLERHILRMRKIYAGRKRAIEEILRNTFGTRLHISGQSTGLHMVLRFPGFCFTEDGTADLVDKGLFIEPVAAYCMKSTLHRDKLILGYGRIQDDRLAAGIRILEEYIDRAAAT
ncbi:MAG: hypothetical protein P8107_09435, partial [Spirochaetia bacterium]